MSALLLAADQNPTFTSRRKSSALKWLSDLGSTSFASGVIAQRRNISGAEACDYCAECIRLLEGLVAPHIESYSALRWLYYLRRLPHSIYSGSVGSTGPNKRALAEAYCAQSSAVGHARLTKHGIFEFPVDDSTLRHLSRFIAFVDVIYDFQVAYRYAGKGSHFKFNISKPWAALPESLPDSQIDLAVGLYDERNDVYNDPLAALLAKAGTGHSECSEAFSILLWMYSEESNLDAAHVLPRNVYPEFFAAAGSGTHVRIGFGPARVDLGEVFRLFRDPVYANEELSERAVLSLVVAIFAEKILSAKPLATLGAATTGYFIVAPDQWDEYANNYYREVIDVLQTHYPQCRVPASFNEFVERAKAIAPVAWPISPGSPIKSSPDYWAIDVWSASSTFMADFQISKRQGEIANRRADQFEDIVQSVIDSSLWKPSPTALTIRRRTLRLAGKSITDIDAIGESNGTLLLVSCKSIPYTQAYDRGDYRDVRNAESTVSDAIRYWADIMVLLRSNLVGDNWDLSGYRQIVGIVCTPFVVFTTNAQALAEAMPKLHSVCSLSELRQWLKKDACS